MLQILGIFSLATFVGSLIAVPWLIGRMPPDFFLTHWHKGETRQHRHPAVALLTLVLRNSLGLLLLLAGIAMLMLPGQGLLTMLIGLCLMDFPGKRRLLGRMVQNARIQRGLNWVRRKQGKTKFAFAEKREEAND